MYVIYLFTSSVSKLKDRSRCENMITVVALGVLGRNVEFCMTHGRACNTGNILVRRCINV